MKKIIAVLVCVAMLLALCPVLGGAQTQTAQTIYAVDFENGTVGAKPPMGSTNWTISGIAENVEKGAYVRIGEETDGGNKVLKLYRSAESTDNAGIRGSCSLKLSGYETLVLRCRVKGNGGAGGSILMNTTEGNKTFCTVMAQEWTNVEINFDLVGQQATVVVGDAEPTTVALRSDCASDSASIRFLANGLQPGVNSVYYDDIYIATYDEGVYIRQSPVAGKQQVYWQYVLPENAISAQSYVNNTVAHPRVLVTDWDTIRAKVQATEETRAWYANIKAAADAALASTPQKYVDDNGHLKLYAARNARDRLQALAFAYNVEQNPAYATKAYEEMLYYGAYKNWSGFGQTLVCAEILFGFACAYDWLYGALDATQKAEIIEIMKTQAFAGYVYNYEDMFDWSFAKISINWNPVCNAAAMMAAMAIADEEPEMSEYFMEKALPSITRALAPYAPEGAYPEGVSYWDYGTSYLLFANHLLETGLKADFELDEAYKLWKAPGIEQTCDFGIYMNGPKGRFDYGDCVSGYTSCEVMYWAAERFNKPYYAWWQNNIQKETGSYLTGYPAMMSLVWYNPDNAYLKAGDFTLDKFYTASTSKFNGFSARSSWDNATAMFTAMQGGINKGSHLHQTLGTYVVDYNGKRFIRQADGANYDLANEEASNVIYGHRAEAGNCLVINPTVNYDQKYGAFAALTDYESNAKSAYGILDMNDVYSTIKDAEGVPVVTSAKRGLKLTHERSRVVVQDEVALASLSELYWFAATDATVTIAEDGRSAVLDMSGEKMLARILEAPAEAKFEMMDRKSVVEEGVINNATSGQKLALHMENQVGDVTIAVEYVPLADAENVPGASAVVPLASWTEQLGQSATTQTSYIVDGDALQFTTNFVGEAVNNGYLAVTLYKDKQPVATKLTAYKGEGSVTSTFAKQDFDEAKIVFVENFWSLRILAAPETVLK